MDEIRFYRAQGEFGFLSNLYRAPVRFEGREFRSAEDAYQFGKPRRPDVAEWLVSAPSVHLCALTAHALLPRDVRPGWSGVKVDRMRRVLEAKFQTHPDLAAKLVATGDAVLVEASKTDSFWGVGRMGDGKNMLGVLLMEVREEFSACGLARRRAKP